MVPSLAILILLATSGAPVLDEPLQRAKDMYEAVGANVHIEYTDGKYGDPGRVLSSLNYLGVKHVRDAAPNPSNQGQGGYLMLAKAGIKFDLFINGEAIAPALRRVGDLERAIPGSVVSIEGMNEVNNHHHFRFGAETDPHRAGRAYQESLYGSVKADPTLSAIPVVAFTDYPFTPGQSDVSNDHPYPGGDTAPLATLHSTVAALRKQEPSHPVHLTELGYRTSRGRPGVSELAQARLLLASLLDAATLGVRRTYIYELLDAYSDPSGSDAEKHFGLFDINYNPKVAARTVRRFLTILDDRAASAATFPLLPINLTWPSLPAEVHHLVLQKASGELVIAIWRDTAVYDFSTLDDRDVAPLVVDVPLPKLGDSAVVTDPVAETHGLIKPGVRVTRVQLGADPILIQVPLAVRPAARSFSLEKRRFGRLQAPPPPAHPLESYLAWASPSDSCSAGVASAASLLGPSGRL